MRVLVTGGSGFIGRWVVKEFLDRGWQVLVLDDFSNSTPENLKEFKNNPLLVDLIEGDIRNLGDLMKAFKFDPDTCVHLAAKINVQESLERPCESFTVDVAGTFQILEMARINNTRLVFMSTCMVYDAANVTKKITEMHPVKPASPYAAVKLAAEKLVESYYHSYALPVTILRPFNTYGPFQKTNSEGGVVAIFMQRSLQKLPLQIYGNGTQTRDLLYVKDCAKFVYEASVNPKAIGETINAGTDKDIRIIDLAHKISKRESEVKPIPHIHPQSEIYKLVCDSTKANQLLGWSAETSLEEGISMTRNWILKQQRQ